MHRSNLTRTAARAKAAACLTFANVTGVLAAMAIMGACVPPLAVGYGYATFSNAMLYAMLALCCIGYASLGGGCIALAMRAHYLRHANRRIGR